MPSDSHEAKVLRLVERSAELWPIIDDAILQRQRTAIWPLELDDIRQLEPVREFYALSEQFLALMGEVQP